MNRCRHSPSSIFNQLGTFILYPLATVLAMGAVVSVVHQIVGNASAIWSNQFPSGEVIKLVICIFASCFLICFAGQSCLFEMRRFMLVKDGLIIGYSKKNSHLISWSSISEIAVSAFQASASREQHQNVICFFLYPKPNDFESKILNYSYGIRNRDRFVLIDYSDTLLDQLLDLYPGKINDYRNRQTM